MSREISLFPQNLYNTIYSMCILLKKVTITVTVFKLETLTPHKSSISVYHVQVFMTIWQLKTLVLCFLKSSSINPLSGIVRYHMFKEAVVANESVCPLASFSTFHITCH